MNKKIAAGLLIAASVVCATACDRTTAEDAYTHAEAAIAINENLMREVREATDRIDELENKVQELEYEDSDLSRRIDNLEYR
jgi:peptidoglycan hydrolase CwlO-like protein